METGWRWKEGANGDIYISVNNKNKEKSMPPTLTVSRALCDVKGGKDT